MIKVIENISESDYTYINKYTLRHINKYVFDTSYFNSFTLVKYSILFILFKYFIY